MRRAFYRVLRYGGLAGLAWYGAAAAESTRDIDTLEASAASHVAAFSAYETEHTNLVLRYRGLVDALTQRLKFGTVPDNPALIKDLQETRTSLQTLGDTSERLDQLTRDLIDDAARANTLTHDTRAGLVELDADENLLQPLIQRLGVATDNLYHALGQALDERGKQVELMKTEDQALNGLSQAVGAGRLPGNGSADTGLAEMLAPPALMAPPRPAAPIITPGAGLLVERPPPAGRWSIQFGLFQNEDDAGFIMARLSLRGIQARYLAEKDKRGKPAFKVVTRGFPTRAAAEAAATELGQDDLHPSGVVELPE